MKVYSSDRTSVVTSAESGTLQSLLTGEQYLKEAAASLKELIARAKKLKAKAAKSKKKDAEEGEVDDDWVTEVQSDIAGVTRLIEIALKEIQDGEGAED